MPIISDSLDELIKAVDHATDESAGLVGEERLRLSKACVSVIVDYRGLQDKVLMLDTVLTDASRREAELLKRIDKLEGKRT